jgi:2'-5' RNA ligase
MTDEQAPLILTLAFDDAAFAHLDGLRWRHFPPERNFIPAHLTLFHHLPGAEQARILTDLAAEGLHQPFFAMQAVNVRFLGRGVAIQLQAPELLPLRQRLAAAWAPWLGAQDRQPFRPHVTVQNKVAPSVARELHDLLAAKFEPFPVEARGFLLWHYRGGPWERAAAVPFRAAPRGNPAAQRSRSTQIAAWSDAASSGRVSSG